MLEKEVIEEIGNIINDSVKTSISSYRIGLYIVIPCCIIYFILLIILQFKLKTRELKNSIEIEKKKDVMECLKFFYNELSDVQMKLLDLNNKKSIEKSIRDIRSNLSKESIKLSKNSIILINNLLDCFSSSVIDLNCRKREIENQYFDELKKEYSKV